jgi:Thioredoxin
VNRLLLALLIVAIAAGVALVLRRRRPADAPTQARHLAPTQLDRRDFPGPDRDWLLAVFTSATCSTCHDVARKAAVLASPSVEVAEIEYSANRELHQRYRIEAVPTAVLADREGVVRRAFMGPVTATDLWAAVAEAREPGSSPEPELGTTDN